MIDTTEPTECPDNTFSPSDAEIDAAWTVANEAGFPLHHSHIRKMLYAAWLVRHGQKE
jgi:hypothetical protein